MFSRIAIPSFQNTDSAWVEIYLSSVGGSLHPDYRNEIRSAIEQTLTEKKSAEKVYYSTSHARAIGGFALSNRPIGFDIEAQDRVQNNTISRVSQNSEVSEAPTHTHLWTAKEAAYKSLAKFSQPTVISSIQIGQWTQTNHFKLTNESSFGAPEGCGITWTFDSHICAVYFF
ncbi:MAG: 4'-phosphopantetheinyl transferase superfamily protein [Bdellovibrionaceae bacterium]|nr:4'-phosphopantetheinyl transferase superfamily protein [Pseudobdellovibrionaceae bacterium]